MTRNDADQERYQRWAQDMANAIGAPAYTVTGPQGVRVQAFPVNRTDELRGWVVLASAQPGESASPAWWERAIAGECSHGGHGWDGETCSDAPSVTG
jgi:hypothetical protein